MSDTSNAFSLEGFNRQKQLSGLHARRPENRDNYYDLINIYTEPQYVSILRTEVTQVGYNYPLNSSVVFPLPEHPDGTRASGIPVFELYENSIYISNPGNSYELYNSFSIYSNNLPIGFASVSETGVNGSVTKLLVFSQPGHSNMFENLSIISDTNNNSANLIFNNNFAIVGITMTSVGIGYQTFSSNYTLLDHDPIVYPFTASEFDDIAYIDYFYSVDPPPIGLVAKANKEPYIYYTNIDLSTNTRDALINELIQENNPIFPLFNYSVIQSFSLGSPQ